MIVKTTDAARLAEFGIVCTHFKDACDNIVEFPERDMELRKPLAIDIAGKGNRISFSGHSLPLGRIRCLGDGAQANFVCRGEVNIDIWLYNNATIDIDEPFAIFGLSAFIYDNTSLSIGKDCLMAEGIEIWTSDHHSIIDLETLKQINFPCDVRIAGRVWLARGVTILKGVEICSGSIIAARSLVSGTVPSKELWGGVPAKCLRRNVSWVPSHPANRSDIEKLKML